jgi:XTP/dITP diphosphohydrolase
VHTIDAVPVEEDGRTFTENARRKADGWAAALASGFRSAPTDDGWVLADDSGLEVEALGGAPGIHSARYAGIDATDADNRRKLVTELRALGLDQSPARFVCALCLRSPAGEVTAVEGVCDGRIILQERGESGFGYDPLFIPAGYDQTFGELGAEVKDRLSHRGVAVRELCARL